MSAESPSNFLHGFDARSHYLGAPEIQIFRSPSGRIVLPQLLEIFLEQVSADGLEIASEQILEAVLLVGGEIRLAFEDAPTCFFKEWFIASLRHLARLGGAYIIQCVIELGDDVKPVENIQRLRAFAFDHVQVGLPHVRANELDFPTDFRTDEDEELLECFHGSLLAYPE